MLFGQIMSENVDSIHSFVHSKFIHYFPYHYSLAFGVYKVILIAYICDTMKKIKVENLGVIKQGEVDISKPLTIFTGPNNSGKSYMAYLIYGCLKFANNKKTDKLNIKQLVSEVFAVNDLDINLEIKKNTTNRQKPYFFPAERSSIHFFSNELLQKKANTLNEVAKIIQSNDAENSIKKIKENGTLIPRYPLVINDYLSYSSDFKYFAKQALSEFEDLAKELERILEGKISVDAYGSLEFKPKGTRKKIPLYLSSSMVKSFGGLVIYLRYLAREHDYIIIDEPELNLHPSTQVKLARLLAKMANRGIKLLMSTHSDYIISELSNLILLADDFKGKKALQKKYNYKKDDFIKAEDVGVYAFQNDTIEEVSTTEQGIEIDKIRKVIGDMNQRSNDIYYIHLDSLEDAPI